MREFRNEKDFNIVMYGNLLVYYTDVRAFYEECGYPKVNELDNSELWELYGHDVGQVVKLLIYQTEKWECRLSIADQPMVATFH